MPGGAPPERVLRGIVSRWDGVARSRRGAEPASLIALKTPTRCTHTHSAIAC